MSRMRRAFRELVVTIAPRKKPSVIQDAGDKYYPWPKGGYFSDECVKLTAYVYGVDSFRDDETCAACRAGEPCVKRITMHRGCGSIQEVIHGVAKELS